MHPTHLLPAFALCLLACTVDVGGDGRSDADEPENEVADGAVAADAATETPDAFVPEPDAFVSEPDAFVPEPDAFVPEPDAFVPQPEPDAFVPEPDAGFPCGVPCADGFDCVDGECLSNGCADGEREGFTDLGGFPEVAACSGGWDVAGMGAEEPACGRGAGDDGDNTAGVGCTVQDLCAEGWAVCADADELAGALPDGASCEDLEPTVGGRPLFASAQRGSNQVGLSCDGMGTNDVFGCGAPSMNLRANCAPFNRSIAGGEPAPWSLGRRAAFNTTEWDVARKPGSARGGVLCCRRPPEAGCADGEREGFDDAHRFPDIAACSGGFAIGGLSHEVPACGRAGGDDAELFAGQGCNIQDLCAEGWHVCNDATDVLEHLPRGASCEDLDTDVPDAPMFVTRQRGSNQVGLSCDGLGTNDIFGCRTPANFVRANCAPLNRTMAGGERAPWRLGRRAAFNTTEWNVVNKPGAGRGGVMCCRD